MILGNKSGGKLVIHEHRRVRTKDKAVAYALSVTGRRNVREITSLQ